MALHGYLTDTNKRINSTKAVPITGATDELCTLKETTNIVRPTLLLNHGVSWNPSTYNYCTIPEFDRKYFIDRWYWDAGVWACECTEDVLASFKTEIGQQSKFVLRSASHPGKYVADYFYPLTARSTHNYIGTTFAWSHSFSTGYFVVGVIGQGGSGGVSAGSVTYLVMTSQELASMVTYMLQGLGSTDWTDGNAIKNNIARVIADPLQYIVSCMYFPVQPPTSTGTIPVTFGYWSIPNLNVHLLSAPMDTYTYGLDISAHSGYGHEDSPYFWAWLEPYNSFVLMCNPWGTFPLETSLIAGKHYMGFEVKIDFISGMGLCNIYTHNNNSALSFSRTDVLAASKSAQVGVQLQLSNNTSSILNAVASTVSGTASGATVGGGIGGAVGAVIGGLASGIVNAVTSTASNFVSSGSNGGISGDEGMPSLHIYHKYSVFPSDISEFGTVCCNVLTLSTLSGYIKCADGNNTVNALKEEKEMIGEFLVNGFYYE